VKKLLIFVSLLLSFKTFAVDCPDVAESDGHVTLHELKLSNGICTVTLSDARFSTTKPIHKIYPSRTMIWDSEGRITSFIDSGHATGARVYYVVPVNSSLKISGTMKHARAYGVTASEKSWSVDKNSVAFHVPPSCQGHVDPASMGNQGGLMVNSCENKIVIDAGWKIGSSPDLEREGESVIHDPEGASCSVSNRALFTYSPGEEPSPRFLSSGDWLGFLKSQPQCKNLKLDFLQEPTAPAAPASKPHGAS
jgi:hypothetical protein